MKSLQKTKRLLFCFLAITGIGLSCIPLNSQVLSKLAVNKNETVVMALTLDGISIKEDTEETWGDIAFSVWEIDKQGNKIKQIPNNIKKTEVTWHKDSQHPIKATKSLFHPNNYARYHRIPENPLPYSKVKNINRTVHYRLDKKKLEERLYIVEYNLQLFCNHKDNHFAMNGVHGMARTRTGNLKMMYSPKLELWMYSKPFPTDSNRIHSFMLHFKHKVIEGV